MRGRKRKRKPVLKIRTVIDFENAKTSKCDFYHRKSLNIFLFIEYKHQKVIRPMRHFYNYYIHKWQTLVFSLAYAIFTF